MAVKPLNGLSVQAITAPHLLAKYWCSKEIIYRCLSIDVCTVSLLAHSLIISNVSLATTADIFVHCHHCHYRSDQDDSLQSTTVLFRSPIAMSGTLCRTSSHQLRLSLFSGIDSKPTCSLVRSRI